MKELVKYSTCGREFDCYDKAKEFARHKFVEKYDHLTLGEVKTLIAEDGALKEYVKDLYWHSGNEQTRYKIEMIYPSKFEACDGSVFDTPEEAHAYEDTIIKKMMSQLPASQLIYEAGKSNPVMATDLRNACLKIAGYSV